MSLAPTIRNSQARWNESDDRIMLAHGAGGQLTDELVSRLFLPRLGNGALDELLDCGIRQVDSAGWALTIDSYVVRPLVFPGGDIGRLCISGAVNDLAVCGALPLSIALSFIIEDGFALEALERIVDSIRDTAREAGVHVTTGDTKVVGRGECDELFITTAAVGRVMPSRRLHPDQIRAGDVLIINGPIGDHGLAVMLAREMPEVHSVVRSDVAPLNDMILDLLARVPQVVFMRDPTRGGLAGVVADISQRSGRHVTLDEQAIPVRHETLHAAEMLGLDPLEVANEGKVLIVVRPEAADEALRVLNQHPFGREAQIIGRVEEAEDGICEVITALGGRRIVQKPYGEQLSRIC